MEPTNTGPARASRLVAIALVSAAVIVLQITVTRILSVVVWYHWAFFSISLSMLGVGAPGVWFALTRPRPETLGRTLLAASALVPLAVIGILKGTHLFRDDAILYCMACLLPATLALGAAVCQLLLEGGDEGIAKLYASDLLGACVASLLVIPLLWVIPTPQLAAGVAILPLAACVIVGGPRRVAAAVAVGLVALLAWREPFVLRHGKFHDEVEAHETPIYERWTPTARLTVFNSLFFAMNRAAAFTWGVGTRPQSRARLQQYWIEQDASAGTPITRFDGNQQNLGFLFDDVTSAAYQLRAPASVAIVGAGGGRDILTALASGARSIDAIELNAGTVDALRGPFGDFAGHVYERPGVRAIVGEGRSVLTRSDRRYDVIQISLIDSFAATAAGAYTLSENNLYTVEAYRLYWSRLAPDGVLSTSRWMRGAMGIELPRLLILVRAALDAEGVRDPAAHVAVLQGSFVVTVLIKRSPFTPAEVTRLRDIAALRGFSMHLPPSDLPPEQRALTASFTRAMSEGARAYAGEGLRMEPPTDDRPFFFQVLSPLRKIRADVVARNGFNAEGVRALQELMLIMTALTLAVFFAPFPLARWLKPAPGFWRGSLYFTAIGLAFMFVEIPWLQRFVLYLGHPSHATTVTLGGILLGAGLGSFASSRVDIARVRRVGWLLPLAVVLGNALLGPLFLATLGLGWWARLLIALAVIVPVGFLMGHCFPLGMARFGERNKAWFWALNGAAGVLASVGSLALSMELGFSRVAMLGAGLYLAAWALLAGGSRAEG